VEVGRRLPFIIPLSKSILISGQEGVLFNCADVPEYKFRAKTNTIMFFISEWF
jgi:hypothetical protein